MSPEVSPFVKSQQQEHGKHDTELAYHGHSMLTKENTRSSATTDAPKSNFSVTLIWMAINTLATIGILFTNKVIFSDPSLGGLQVTLAAYHFTLTWLVLYTSSLPCLAFFPPRKTSVATIAPLSIAMSVNVTSLNLSLAYSSVTFYQVARIPLSPCVAAIGYILCKSTIPRNALLSLLPTCAGVGMVSSTMGVVFTFSSVFISSLYTIWIASYHQKLQLSSLQLLLNQAPVSAFLLLFAIPFIDTFPAWDSIEPRWWAAIFMSGMFAPLVNLSQFVIIARTGPVSSTVVGHIKTCCIVALGWVISGRKVADMSLVGIFIALGGLTLYYIVMLK